VYLVFQDIVGTPPKYVERKKGTKSIEFRTYRLLFFKFYHDHFYDINLKGDLVRKIPDLLSRWLTEISLAFWFMGDGSKDKSGYLLHTENLTLHYNKLLQQILGKKFGLEVSIHTDSKNNKSFYRLYIAKNSVEKFNQLVTPYIVPSCRYKLHGQSSDTKDLLEF